MKKAKVLQPKYDLNEHIVFGIPNDSGHGPSKKIGIIEKVTIEMSSTSRQVLYQVSGDDAPVAEERVLRRIVL